MKSERIDVDIQTEPESIIKKRDQSLSRVPASTKNIIRNARHYTMTRNTIQKIPPNFIQSLEEHEDFKINTSKPKNEKLENPVRKTIMHNQKIIKSMDLRENTLKNEMVDKKQTFTNNNNQIFENIDSKTENTNKTFSQKKEYFCVIQNIIKSSGKLYTPAVVFSETPEKLKKIIISRSSVPKTQRALPNINSNENNILSSRILSNSNNSKYKNVPYQNILSFKRSIPSIKAIVRGEGLEQYKNTKVLCKKRINKFLSTQENTKINELCRSESIDLSRNKCTCEKHGKKCNHKHIMLKKKSCGLIQGSEILILPEISRWDTIPKQ